MRPTPPRILNAKGYRSFGGSQMWFENKVMLNSGCGIVAGCDAVMRLLDEDEFSKDDYMTRLNEATTFIKPIMLPFKMKPLIIAGQEFLGSFGVSPGRFKRGVRKLSRAHGIEVTIKGLGLGYKKKLPGYLEAGVPVAMLMAAPFTPVKLVSETGHEEKAQFHWVTVTGFDGETFTVSSWGNKYTIDLKDITRFGSTAAFYAVLPKE